MRRSCLCKTVTLKFYNKAKSGTQVGACNISSASVELDVLFNSSLQNKIFLRCVSRKPHPSLIKKQNQLMFVSILPGAPT